MKTGRKNILVTGSHRSGSTWVGKILSSSSQVGYIQEPFNPGHRPGICNLPVSRWFEYVCTDNEQAFVEPLHRSLSFQYDYKAELTACVSPKDYLRMFRDSGLFAFHRMTSSTALMKDPIAFFSAPWLASTFDMRVLILVRHPAAFAHSLKRLNWTFDFSNLLSQPLLMRDFLQPFESEMNKALIDEVDILEQAALLWKIIYSTALTFCQNKPEFILVTHEELSTNPEDGFKNLCNLTGIEWTPAVQKVVRSTTSQNNPAAAPEGAIHFHQRDSAKSIERWKDDLSAQEVATIRTIAGHVASEYYPENTWEIRHSA